MVGAIFSILLSSLVTAVSADNGWTENCSHVIDKDVVIFGGGGSGAQAAVRLREDYNKTVVVIEKQCNLGGHVETYIDSISGKPFDYGVESYTEYGGAKDFFARFNITLVKTMYHPINTTYIDFLTGDPLPLYHDPQPPAFVAALKSYLTLAEKYENITFPSFVNFPSPPDIPAELLLPFKTIAETYKLEAALPLIFEGTGWGLGDISTAPLLDVLQELPAVLTRAFLGELASWVPESGSNQELYDRIGALLSSDVLYDATIISTRRSDDGVQVLVSDAHGEQTLIRARKLLVSIALTDDNLPLLDLSPNEEEIFSTWAPDNIYCGIVSGPGLPVNGSLVNIASGAVPENYTVFPTPPFVVRFQYSGDDNFRVLATGTETYTEDMARQLIVDTYERITKDVRGDGPRDQLDIKAFSAHRTTSFHVPENKVRDGFYGNLTALQGGRSTWFTGRAWGGQYSTTLWGFNDQWLLPHLVADLEAGS
ncbi:unnamed protein product [Zymoseptoria tritici ST99CH_1A5]|uniref:Amine oxidase domain-containing protein n=1 Tax=Zymoseptoria tritici ST99CH_1A5 TaxID=1276529 RepID=A0A1Y6LL91_ZYMTR|nr:unnamed protein product [Zymoseptoria tritici ST99CH_1A5]